MTTTPHAQADTRLTARRIQSKSRRLREALIAYSFIAPWIIGFVIFTGGPIVASFALSFFKWKIITPPRYIALDNYIKMFSDDQWFLLSIGVTLKYLLLYVPLAQLLALLLAVLLNQKVRSLGFWRTIFYLPAVVSGVAGSVLWLWMYHNELGVINNVLQLIGFEGRKWLYDTDVVLGALVVKSLWNVGVPMVIYLAALQGMPQTLYEAAEIDGGGDWTNFRSITLPMLSPAIFFNVVIGIISGIQTFAEPYVMTRGGPENATLFLGLYLYQTAFSYLNMGYASAMAWIMFVVIFTLTFVQFKLANRWVYYDG
ncbi:MAG: sugar ABC transporter permease [Chloroflexi bacterium]|nr:sugar ABC transporter permease [Chloroflexota bacterium]